MAGRLRSAITPMWGSKVVSGARFAISSVIIVIIVEIQVIGTMLGFRLIEMMKYLAI